MRSTTRTFAAVALVLFVGACSSGGSDDTDPPTTTTEAGEGTTTSTGPDDEPTTTGGGTDGGDEADYVEALANGLATQGDDSELVITEDQADCMAPAWVDIVTVETLVAAEAAPADLEDPDFSYTELGLSVEEGVALISAAMGCDVDLVGQFTEFLAQDLDPTQTACLEGELTDDLVERFLAEALVVEDPSIELEAEFDAVTATCGLED